jgi:hypothetical protein
MVISQIILRFSTFSVFDPLFQHLIKFTGDGAINTVSMLLKTLSKIFRISDEIKIRKTDNSAQHCSFQNIACKKLKIRTPMPGIEPGSPG